MSLKIKDSSKIGNFRSARKSSISDILELENFGFSSVKEKYLQFIASFLIVLVLSLPFHITIVHATINQISVKGSDGIEGFAKSPDFLNFNAQASIGNTTITKEQVVLGANITFDKCSNLPNNVSECTLRFPSTGKETFEAKAIPFTINLYKDKNKQQIDDSKPSSVIIDNKAPQVKLTLSKNKFSSQDSVVANYEVTDFACNDPSCSNKCVGIKNIEFNTLDNSFKQVVSPNTTECSIKSSISIDIEKLKDGKNSVFAKATDNFNQISQNVSVEFIVDTTGPAILANSFVISRKGTSLNTFSPNSVPVEVLVNISADDLDVNSVIANLSALNPLLKTAKASCTAGSDLHACKWSINLNPGTSGSKTIVVNASDILGNKESATISKSLALDDKGPVVQSLSTATTKDNKVFAKPTGNTITAVFNEVTGLSSEEVFLHVDGSKKTATYCSKEANWVCKWENVDFGSVDKSSLSIQSDTIDLLLNPVSEVKTIEVVIDSKLPVVSEADIGLSAVGTLSDLNPELFKIGDKIAAVANVTEENDLVAVADFSKFIKGASKVEGSCKKLQEDKQQCTWLTDAITFAASDVIKFNFTDVAGNEVIVAKRLQTLGLEETKVPDFWKNSFACSPKNVDRQLGPFINQRVYCNLKLEPKSTSKPVLTVFIGPAECTGEGKKFVQNIETFNKEVGGTSPIIKITLKKDEFRINEANLSCSLNIFSRVNDLITKNPEIETANISIQFYNLPLGEVSENVQEKIDKAKNDAKEFRKIIGALNKIIVTSKKICQLFGMIYNIVTIYHIATGKEKEAADAAAASIVGAPAALGLHALGTASCYGQQKAEDLADKGWVTTGGKFCKFVNCQWAPGPLVKWQDYMTKQVNKLPLASYLPGPSPVAQPGLGIQYPIDGRRDGLAGYMDPNNNFFVAALFGCIPGVITGLDKYSQIKCLYADCLQNAVGKDGLPVTACEDQKSYATCKYIYGEVFALIPYAAVFDHFTGIIKEALSNPFSIAGIVVGAACRHVCPVPPPGSSAAYYACATFRVVSKAGEVLQNVRGLVNEGFKIRQDYCSRLDLEEEKEEKEE